METKFSFSARLWNSLGDLYADLGARETNVGLLEYGQCTGICGQSAARIQAQPQWLGTSDTADMACFAALAVSCRGCDYGHSAEHLAGQLSYWLHALCRLPQISGC